MFDPCDGGCEQEQETKGQMRNVKSKEKRYNKLVRCADMIYDLWVDSNNENHIIYIFTSVQPD